MITANVRKGKPVRIEVPAITASTSRSVNRYVEATLRAVALERARDEARAAVQVARGALTGAQLAESARILTASILGGRP